MPPVTAVAARSAVTSVATSAAVTPVGRRRGCSTCSWRFRRRRRHRRPPLPELACWPASNPPRPPVPACPRHRRRRPFRRDQRRHQRRRYPRGASKGMLDVLYGPAARRRECSTRCRPAGAPRRQRERQPSRCGGQPSGHTTSTTPPSTESVQSLAAVRRSTTSSPGWPRTRRGCRWATAGSPPSGAGPRLCSQ